MQWDHLPGTPKLGKSAPTLEAAPAGKSWTRSPSASSSARIATRSGHSSVPAGLPDSYTVKLMRCAKCGLWKAPSEFPNSRTRQFSYCRECRRAYDRRYYHDRGKAARSIRKRARAKEARAWMNALKEGVPCCDCGRLFPVWVMHWDHLPGYEQLGCISEMVGNRSR